MKTLEQIQEQLRLAKVFQAPAQKRFDELHDELHEAEKSRNTRKVRAVLDKIEGARVDKERNDSIVSTLEWVLTAAPS